jgi:GH15 family glucan-1,4-alpha-glucosidase
VYERIENYGVIGNLRTVALVSPRGSIDWYCVPHFDSPSVFAALLDDEKGGRFRLAPLDDEVTCKQLYWPATNVLVTRFLTPHGVGELEDFMPSALAPVFGGADQLVRRLKVVRGSMQFELTCEPMFDYARAPPKVTLAQHGAVFEGPGLTLSLSTTLPLERSARGVRARFELREGERAIFVLRPVDHGCATCMPAPSEALWQEAFETTVRYWRGWLKHCTYRGRWRETVERSALILKLMTFEPTGAMVAAPTCSLPERFGGGRNWDYRYCWLRDAAFMLYGFLRIGFTDEAARFMDWLEARARDGGNPPLQIVYALDGRRDLPELTLDHLAGYRGSAPVRIGNGAADQLQLDIYGELMDAVYLFNKYGTPISFDLWTHLRRILNWVCDNWRQPDHGIWESRGKLRHFTYSKLMCWVALDRGVRLALKRSFPADLARWIADRDALYMDIMTQGFSEERHAFNQFFGSDRLDASDLIMPLVFFVSPTDPKMLQTIDAIARPPHEGGLLSDGLVYRYDPERTEDGLTGREGTFNMCTFWLVEAMTRAGRVDRRRLERARLLFERMLGYASHLGLYAEQTGDTGEALGNYPQAFTHLALISAAFNLDRALSGAH